MKIDPIIAVKDVRKSASWYENFFDLKGKHGGDEFEVLVSESGEVELCLHKWGAHDHPTSRNSTSTPANGIILYFRVHYLDTIHARIMTAEYPLLREIKINPNTHVKEFSLLDLDGYYLTISAFHKF